MQGVSIHRVNTLDHDQIDKATAVMIESFTHTSDPLLVAYVGGDMSLCQALFKAFIVAAINDGEAYFAQADNEIIGVSCWFGPGKQFVKSPQQREWEHYWNQGLSQAGKDWQTDTYLPTYTALYSRCMPTPTAKLDSYNLSLLGVLPAFRGKGIGRRLVQEGLERAQEQGALVTLDTFTKENVLFYERCGLHVGGTGKIDCPWAKLEMNILIWEPKKHV